MCAGKRTLFRRRMVAPKPMLECECGSNEFIKEVNHLKYLVSPRGRVLYKPMTGDIEVWYHCKMCGKEITPRRR
jgi:hypothetical protein